MSVGELSIDLVDQFMALPRRLLYFTFQSDDESLNLPDLFLQMVAFSGQDKFSYTVWILYCR